ncbi:MAG: Gfo/Idh/MocA family oxidoreductase [Phycisphaerae bacterium]|nr:Gfo/Idh/MocA family oxidoreductase [Phycisphaerae bacterium]
MKPLRIGIVGGGGIVRTRHMPGLAAIDGIEIVAVCNRRRASAERFAADFGIPRVVDRWEDVVAMDDVDIVWIGTTPYLHCPIATAALAADKHVFCQARMCMDLDEALTMVAAADAHPDLAVRICPPPMGMAGDRTMRRLLRKERLVGDVRHVRLRNLASTLLDPDYPLHWRIQREQSGLNVAALGIYVEVLNRWLAPATHVATMSRIWTQHRRHPDTGEPAAVEIPESVNILVDLADGALGVYEVNGVSAHAPGDALEIYGTEGTIVYHFGDDRIEAARRGETSLRPVPIPANERCDWSVEADFVHQVRAGEKIGLAPDFREGLKYMAFLEAVHRSAATGEAVRVSEQGRSK